MTTTQTIFTAKISDRYLLTKEGSTKKTYHIRLKLPSPIDYQVGDSIAIFPINPINTVEKLLTFFPNNQTIAHKKTLKTHSIKEFFSKHANIGKLTSKLLKKLFEKTSCEKIQHLLLVENKALLKEYLEQRELIDLIEEYPNALEAQDLADCLLPLLPRYYSIASSCKKDPGVIDLTVAYVSYTSLDKPRVGVGSHFLCQEACIDDTFSFFIHPSNGFTLPEPSTPIIMIGPGTGIAPFKAFLEERIAENAPGKNWLFFGERNQKTDFYYDEFFKQLESENKLQLCTAFSRDQEEKLYVQHLLYQNKKELFSWIENGAIIYVCGDAKKMAKDVEKTFLQIFSEEKNLSETEAKEHLKTLRKERRYLTDVY